MTVEPQLSSATVASCERVDGAGVKEACSADSIADAGVQSPSQ